MKPVKNQLKAQKIVSGAVGTFAKAIADVTKANDLLVKDVIAKDEELIRITAQIEDAYKQLDIVQAEKLNTQSTIIQNKELIGKLEQFTK